VPEPAQGKGSTGKDGVVCENLRKEIEGLKDEEANQQRALNDYLLNLEVE